MPSYAEQLNAHLAAYKTGHLGVQEPGTFFHRGRELQYQHILPKEKQWMNILEPFRRDVQQYLADRPNIKLHRYFHHLNSSQAFTLNLFFPYFECGGSAQLLRAFGSQGELSSWEPECVVDAIEGTNVDVTWVADGARTYCEVKLSEQEFGSAADDAAHRHKLETIYRPKLASLCASELLEPKHFFENYQLFRNVWLAAREAGSSVVFLVPRANTRIWRQLSVFLGSLSPAISSRVRAVAVEDVLASLAVAEGLPTPLTSYATLLSAKYAPAAAA